MRALISQIGHGLLWIVRKYAYFPEFCSRKIRKSIKWSQEEEISPGLGGLSFFLGARLRKFPDHRPCCLIGKECGHLHNEWTRYVTNLCALYRVVNATNIMRGPAKGKGKTPFLSRTGFYGTYLVYTRICLFLSALPLLSGLSHCAGHAQSSVLWSVSTDWLWRGWDPMKILAFIKATHCVSRTGTSRQERSPCSLYRASIKA